MILDPENVDDINELIFEINKFVNLSDTEIKNINNIFPNKKKLNREVVLKRNLTTEEIVSDYLDDDLATYILNNFVIALNNILT